MRDLADRAGVRTSLVSDVLRGRALPRRSVALALLDAAGVKPDARSIVMDLWLEAAQSRSADRPSVVSQEEAARPVPKRGVRRAPQPVPTFGQPDPIRARDAAELTQALRAALVWGGSPLLREMEARSNGRLKRSTISDMLRSTTLPDYDRYIAFLRACGIEARNLDVWVFTWRRLKALETPEITHGCPACGRWTERERVRRTPATFERCPGRDALSQGTVQSWVSAWRSGAVQLHRGRGGG
ncbi:helix-turn-helix transcriptional regulator [Streptomyces sp. NPDC049915]|uniref:helix-turn-helix domain-containing protein n=1 Tax=Streptomyces sp. NPDC049915 TaxID=3155510 RepID=UPI003440E9AA